MAQAGSQEHRSTAWNVFAGATMVVVGVLALAWLVYIGNSSAPAAERAMIRVGLAGAAMLSAVAQGLVLAGGWLLWRAGRRVRSGER